MNEESVASWHADHGRFGQLLDILDEQLRSFTVGKQPDYALSLETVEYLQDYGDTFHHPREDAVFKRLLARRNGMQEPFDRVAQEHRVLAVSGTELRSLLHAAAREDSCPSERLEAILALYVLYYRRHIEFEENDILTSATKVLENEDWNVLAHGFPAKRGGPTLGDLNERFSRIIERASAHVQK